MKRITGLLFRILGIICIICPLCIIRRKMKYSSFAKAISKIKYFCPFCYAYNKSHSTK